MDRFYLDKVYPDPSQIFSFKPKSVHEIKDDCIFIFDTNVLLIPYSISHESVEVYVTIFKKLHEEKRIFIPARVAREFGKNRGQKIADAFGKIIEAKNNLNNSQIRLDKFPIFELDGDYKKLKDIETKINKLKIEFKEQLDILSSKLKGWSWTDPVSELYSEIFNSDTIIEMTESPEKLSENLNYRYDHQVAPGFKASDQKKIDDGIGDLIIWQTTLEIAAIMQKDVIFVTQESQKDWFYRQQNSAVLPKYELIEEFRKFTDGLSICIVDFPTFLETQNATEDIIEEVKVIITDEPELQYADSGFRIITKDDFLKYLKEQEDESNAKGGFVGAKFFVEKFLANLGFDIGNSWEMVKLLDGNEIEIYKWEDPGGNYYPLNAIKVKKTTSGDSNKPVLRLLKPVKLFKKPE